MFRRCRLVILGLAIITFAGTNLCAQRTPRQRGWSYSGDPRAERTPNFRLPMEALLSANSPEDLIRAGTQPGRIPQPRAVAKPQPAAVAETLPTETLPDEEVDPFADDPVAAETPATKPAVVATEPAAPTDDGLTGGQLLGVLGDVAGSFLPDTSRVTEALPPMPGVGPAPGASPPGMQPPPADAAEVDPFSEPAEGADPFADPPADAPPANETASGYTPQATDALPADEDPFATGPAEPAAGEEAMEVDPFQ